MGATVDRIIARLDASPSVDDQVLAERLRHRALMLADYARVIDEGERVARDWASKVKA